MIQLWITFLLDNMFIMFGSDLRRQAIGAPMGTNCAAGLVNLYLCRYELSFVQQLATIYRSPSNPPELVLLCLLIQRAFLFTTRFLDDIGSINNPYFARLLYTDQHYPGTPIRGIYPPTFTISEASSAISMHYLDVTVQPVPGRLNRLTTVHFDKRFVPPMSAHRIVRFPHMSSNIAEEAKYNITVGFFHSFRKAILDKRNFITSMADIIVTLLRKDYDASRMLQDIRRCCLHHPELYGTTPLSVFEQIRLSISDRAH